MANPRLPFVKGWKAKITRIEKIFSQPCGPNPALYVLGYFAASPVLLYSLFTPDCLDHTFDRIGRPHKLGRRLKLDPSDHAKPLPAPTGGIAWHAFQGAKFAQRIGLWTTIVDATLDWVIHGASFTFRLAGCDDPNQGYGQLKMDHTVPLLLPATTSILCSWVRTGDNIFSAGPCGIASPKGHASGASFSITQHMGTFPGLPDCSFSCQIRDRNTGSMSPVITPQPMPDGSRVAHYANPGIGAADKKHNFEVLCTKDFGVMNVSGTFQLSGINLEMIENSACGHSLGGS